LTETQADTAERTAAEILTETKKLVDPEIERRLDGLHPTMRGISRYHFGWQDAEGHPDPHGSGGKALRPALAVLGARAVGAAGDEPAVLDAAAAVELIHNFSLLHDDVIDGDRERRHRPTVWALFGVGEAIIVGDALHTLAMRVLLDSGTLAATRGASALARATDAMIAGQASDMAFETCLDTSLDECVLMEEAKTGALLACAASIGALLADADTAVVEALAGFGRELGLAFQAVDDLLGIWGRPEVTGKPTWSDLRSQKKTLPVVFALSRDDARAEELRALFSNGPLSEVDVARAARIVERCGGRELTEAAADRHLANALDALAAVRLDAGAHEELVELARFVTTREF
jgi:geranylgeranyl diphosphate synthase type I